MRYYITFLILIFAHHVNANQLASVSVTGRYQSAEQGYLTSWPGVYFETHFEGTRIGVEIARDNNLYNVVIDGQHSGVISGESKTTHWFTVANGKHHIRVSKRTESHQRRALFKGFTLGENTRFISAPATKKIKRQIEIIGDSNYAGYGLESPSRTCNGQQVRQYSNADKSLGALTAKALDADYHLNGYSGLGLVRNWNGGRSDVNFRTFFSRTLSTDPTSNWIKPKDWNPDTIVVGLGTNDFSTPLNQNEKWTKATLEQTFKSDYSALIKQIRQTYGAQSLIVLASQPVNGSNYFSNIVEQISEEFRKKGDKNLIHWAISDMEYTGCHWHLSERDHRVASQQLIELIQKKQASTNMSP